MQAAVSSLIRQVLSTASLNKISLFWYCLTSSPISLVDKNVSLSLFSLVSQWDIYTCQAELTQRRSPFCTTELSKLQGHKTPSIPVHTGSPTGRQTWESLSLLRDWQAEQVQLPFCWRGDRTNPVPSKHKFFSTGRFYKSLLLWVSSKNLN